MSQIIKSTKYNSIDLFKFFMAICVIGIHTNPLYNINNPIIHDIYNTVVRSAVPFFFLASGFLLANKLEEPFNSEANIKTIKNYLIKIIKMYLFWTVIYLPLAIYQYVTEKYSVITAIVSYFRSFIFIGQHYNSWMLWYLLSTIFALVFVIFLLKRKLSIKTITVIGFIMAMVGIAFDVLDSEPTLPTVLEYLHKAFSLTFSTGRIFSGMFLIPMGMILNKKKIPLSVNIALLLIFGILRILVKTYPQESTLTLIYPIGLFGIVESIKLKDNKIYPLLRKMSTGMYFIHLYVFSLFCFIVYRKEVLGLKTFLITTVLSILLSYIWIKIKPKIKHTAK